MQRLGPYSKLGTQDTIIIIIIISILKWEKGRVVNYLSS